MKYIILILVLLTSCKKEEVNPCDGIGTLVLTNSSGRYYRVLIEDVEYSFPVTVKKKAGWLKATAYYYSGPYKKKITLTEHFEVFACDTTKGYF